jgi:hypothetical protein
LLIQDGKLALTTSLKKLLSHLFKTAFENDFIRIWITLSRFSATQSLQDLKSYDIDLKAELGLMKRLAKQQPILNCSTLFLFYSDHRYATTLHTSLDFFTGAFLRSLMLLLFSEVYVWCYFLVVIQYWQISPYQTDKQNIFFAQKERKVIIYTHCDLLDQHFSKNYQSCCAAIFFLHLLTFSIYDLQTEVNCFIGLVTKAFFV